MILNVNVTNLTAGTGRSGQNLSAYDNASADARTKRHGNHVGITLTAALPHLSKCSHVGIIVCLHGHVDILMQNLRNVEHAPVGSSAYQES